MRLMLLSSASFLVASVLCGAAPTRPAQAADARMVSSNATSTTLTLNIGQAVVYELPAPASDVLVGDPNVASVVAKSNQRAYLIGKTRGSTNVYFYDADGRQIAGFNIVVFAHSPDADINLVEGYDTWRPLKCKPPGE